ncbi:hypothetical protein UPYG_G00096780 [Umbra pygmaea]|uniref:Uncharacterized protein n=1 Tax=Umbra pygmaea TaxID=75934 RepID=A0ABD0X019_UMBPY
MAESVESVVAKLDSTRNVTIEIKNLTKDYCLKNPKVHLESGGTYIPPQPTVRPQETEICTFIKTSHSLRGSVGVMTYDLFESSSNDFTETLALMFSVPFDYTYYINWYAVGILNKDKGKACDRDLYQKMYNENQKWFSRSAATGTGLNYTEGKCVDIKATMSPMAKSIMKVEIWDKQLKK